MIRNDRAIFSAGWTSIKKLFINILSHLFSCNVLVVQVSFLSKYNFIERKFQQKDTEWKLYKGVLCVLAPIEFYFEITNQERCRLTSNFFFVRVGQQCLVLYYFLSPYSYWKTKMIFLRHHLETVERKVSMVSVNGDEFSYVERERGLSGE